MVAELGVVGEVSDGVIVVGGGGGVGEVFSLLLLSLSLNRRPWTSSTLLTQFSIAGLVGSDSMFDSLNSTVVCLRVKCFVRNLCSIPRRSHSLHW